MNQPLSFFAPCPLGLEHLLAEELRALGATGVRAARAGASFSGDLATGYRACLWSRLAARVLMRVVEVPAGSPEELYDSVRALPWEDHMSVDGTLAVDFTASRSPITHTKYGALKVKDAVVDRFRDREGRRPNVDTVEPDLRINVAARSRSAVISIDLSGSPLHRRGYREQGMQVSAPLKENLAAAVLLFARWPVIAADGGALIDPMCGSGTLAIEGALMAGDIAPGILRAHWGFDGWLGHDTEAWDDLLAEADDRAEAGREAIPPIHARDFDPRAVSLATSCVRRAGLAGLVTVEQADARQTYPAGSASGLVAVNPPYGARLGDTTGARELYGVMGEVLRDRFAGWHVAAITSEEAPATWFGLDVLETHEVYNGAIPALVSVMDAAAGAEDAAPEGDAGTVSASTDSMFANRLRKNLKRLGKWARKQDVTCYRLYDADMPEYSAAIDVYAGAAADEGRIWAHVAEYAPPRNIDPAAAQKRLDEIVATVPVVLGIDPTDVFLKVRRRQKGTEQYSRQDRREVFNTVAEDGLLFAVNLSDYLDTGLFLDHRLTRGYLRAHAEGARFLNLFAYTGAATVHAAAGGAVSTLTVDMSQTYLDWAERNMALNGMIGPAHTRVRADVMVWLKTAAARRNGLFDLIFCDPPSFSNSKRMDSSFDVQRDHIALLTATAGLLAPGGTIVFSNNLRTFAMDLEGLAAAGLAAEDVTASTIPEDFARNPRIHNTWRIGRV